MKNHIVCKLTVAMLAGLCLALLPACHTLKFDIENAPAGKVVEDTHHFYLYGLFPTIEADVSRKCPQGAVAIKEQTTFGDGFIGVITLGIVIPRSVWYYCLPEKRPVTDPAALLRREEPK